MIAREAIFAALFTAATQSTGLRSASRTFKGWDAVDRVDQPALFQVEGSQTASSEYRKPTRWVLHAELVLYVHAATCGQPDVVMALNAEVDAIVAALAPSAAQATQTLGDLVHDCRIVGEIVTSEGRLGEQAVAVIPIEIIPEP